MKDVKKWLADLKANCEDQENFEANIVLHVETLVQIIENLKQPVTVVDNVKPLTPEEEKHWREYISTKPRTFFKKNAWDILDSFIATLDHERKEAKQL